MAQIVIEIDEKGNMKEKTSGFIGKACQVFSAKLKALLQSNGVNVSAEKETPTDEMYNTPITNGQVRY